MNEQRGMKLKKKKRRERVLGKMNTHGSCIPCITITIQRRTGSMDKTKKK